MDLIEAMTIFVEVADTEGFNRAAGKLGISKSAVTRAISQLEDRLNVRLLQRTTRRVSLTEIGRTYLNECREILSHIAITEANVSKRSAETKGEIRIAVSTSFALERLPPIIAGYVEQYPDVIIRLTLLDREIDLVDEGFDVAIVPSRAVTSETSIVRIIATFSNIAVASPAYVRTTGLRLNVPQDLTAQSFIGRMVDAKGRRVTFAAHDETQTLQLVPRFTANNLLMVQRMTVEGMGFSLLPQTLIERELRAKTVVPLMEDFDVLEDQSNICLAYPSRKYLRAVTRTFVDYVVGWPLAGGQT
ncbi:LysR family transcriptional regulator [Caballeronia temeraria]|uniref:LysR family transcriptional regulator n=1 Tax=Caballeronia temeraria TaxID=1777137 RepID=A0A158DVZ9_9BURK|nr:LysR family transcriptional regulator [Caballeronia temeraria]SAK98758.1 LysR family transcriptional regulator [Caballeronia temeraria]